MGYLPHQLVIAGFLNHQQVLLVFLVLAVLALWFERNGSFHQVKKTPSIVSVSLGNNTW